MKTIAIIAAVLCSSCFYTVRPNGSETYQLDAEQAARAIQVFENTQ